MIKLFNFIYFLLKVITVGVILLVSIGYMIFKDDLNHLMDKYMYEILIALIVLGVVLFMRKKGSKKGSDLI